jgi:hypothetical protein
MSTPSMEVGDNVFRGMVTIAMVWLALTKAGCCPPPLTADVGSPSLGLSSGGDDVHH